ncbi:MAG: hypothetical protein O3B41_06095 [Bacteroidetes bacterium]|nr:hypothetical protein [Bacteroidota bacterium]
MLKQIYITFGEAGAFIIAIAMCLVALAWLLALTGTVTRSMQQWKKASLLVLLSIAPPASIPILIAFLINDRKVSPVVAVRRPSTSLTPHKKVL